MVSLSIVIVNYKTPQLLTDCLDSLFQYATGIDYEVIVVDNNSADASKSIIQNRFRQVRWIQLDYNAGFARANNEGIRRSSGEAVLLLNSDTLLTDNAIGNCFTDFQQSPYLACGVQLLNRDGTPQISGNYFMKGGLNNLLALPYTGTFVKFLGTLFNVKKPHVPDAGSAIEVDWINGAFLMVKKPAIDKAGLMDEDFFLYAEEAEWCARLRKIGKLVIYGQYKIIHLQGETSNATFGSKTSGYQNLYDRKGLQIMLSNFVRIRKQWGRGWFIFHLLMYSLTVPVYLLCIPVSAIFAFRNPGPELERWTAFVRNMASLWRYFPKIYSNRPYFYKVL